MINRRSPLVFDDLDYQILQALSGNVRIDAAKVARTLKANERTIRKRINRLLSLGAVKLAAIANPRVFDYTATVEVLLEVALEHEETVLQHLLVLPEVTYVAYGQGEQEILVRAHFKDYSETREFVRRTLPDLPGVNVLHSRLIPRILRNIDEWRPKPEDFDNGSLD